MKQEDFIEGKKYLDPDSGFIFEFVGVNRLSGGLYFKIDEPHPFLTARDSVELTNGDSAVGSVGFSKRWCDFKEYEDTDNPSS